MGRSQLAQHVLARPSLPSSSRKLLSTLQPDRPNLGSSFKTFSQILRQCSDGIALGPGKQAHSRMLVSGYNATVFVSNCLIQMYFKCRRSDYAAKVFDELSERDTVSWNTMIFGFTGTGKTETARSYFDAAPTKDVVSWNSLISGYVKNHEHKESVAAFLRMRSSGVDFDPTSLALVSKSCSSTEDFELGIQIHAVAIKKGHVADVVTGSALLDMYGKCKAPRLSLRVFEEMPAKNGVTWSAAIASCTQNDRHLEALETFNEMRRRGVGPSQSSLASVFRSCAAASAFRLGTQLHGNSLKEGFGPDVLVGTAALDAYAKCGRVPEARRLFDSMPTRNLQSYNALIGGYARARRGDEAFRLFLSLRASGLGFDEVTLSGVFGGCAAAGARAEGAQLHGLAVKSRLETRTCVANALLDMYGKCGSLAESSRVFEGIAGAADEVTWNAIVAACEQNGDGDEALRRFAAMVRSGSEPDQFTYGSVLKACAARVGSGSRAGVEVHGRVIKSGMGSESFVGGALVDMYCKSGMVEEAEKVHRRTAGRTMVSWNAIVTGLARSNRSDDAQRFFYGMLGSGVEPDSFTYAAVLDTCANLATAGLGTQIHAQVVKQRLGYDAYISSTIVDMYSKCGNVRDSRLAFEKARKRDPVTWNAMICGYANHGLGSEAVEVFEEMKSENIRPNWATFVSVLRACAHIGDVEKGIQYFESMRNDYGLAPQLEHYSCLVDLIGRSGQLNEALRIIQEMPFEPDGVIWRTMLGICKLHGNVEMAEMAARNLLRLEPEDSSCYVLLSNVYADSKMWDQMSRTRSEMRDHRLKKEPGCSWIEVKDEFHAFLVGDKSHPRFEEMYETLHLIVDEMRWTGYMPFVYFGEAFEEEEEEEEHTHSQDSAFELLA